jgi:hypothetical protein
LIGGDGARAGDRPPVRRPQMLMDLAKLAMEAYVDARRFGRGV